MVSALCLVDIVLTTDREFQLKNKILFDEQITKTSSIGWNDKDATTDCDWNTTLFLFGKF